MKKCAATFYAILGFITVFNIPVIQIIKVLIFNMNPKFIFFTNFAQILEGNLG